MDIGDLHTERLTLRTVKYTDLEDIHELHSLPETDQYNTLGIPETIDVTRVVLESWILGQQKEVINTYIFAIENNQQFIGLLGLKLGNPKYKMGEVWYKFHSAYWGRGFGTEALVRLLVFGFDILGLHRIEAGCAVENIGSIRVLEKAGMTLEGRKRKVLPLKSRWSDNYEYAILDTDKRG